MTPSGTFVGIDVSKAQFDVAVRPAGEHWTSAHTEAGITMLVARLVSLRRWLHGQPLSQRNARPAL